MSSRSRQQLEEWLKTIKIDHGKVIDFGGSQNPIIGRINFNGSDIITLDLNRPHENRVNAELKYDLNYPIKLSYNDNKYLSGFDWAFCIEVFEYIWNPIQAINNIGLFLKKGGILYSSWHTLYGLHKPEGHDCLRYTKYGIEKILKETGFEIEEIITRKISSEGFINLSRFYQSEGMRILKNDYTFDCGYLIKARRI